MPQVKFSVSALGQYLKPKIATFIKANSDALSSSTESTPEEGSEAIAEAIAYGMALAWSSPIIKSSFAVGIVPPPIPPAVVTPGNPAWGSSMHTALTPSVIEI